MTSTIDRRFTGVARLVGETVFAAYRDAHVCIIGIGGVGSWSAEALARSGVGMLTLIDLDMVGESNVNRQIHALDDVFGAAKVDVMKDRIARINPRCRVVAVEDFITPENLTVLLAATPTIIIDAIDQVRAKVALAVHCVRSRIPLVVAGAAGGKTDPGRIRIEDLTLTTQDPLLSKMRARLRKEHGFPRGVRQKFGITAIYSDEPVRTPENAACQPIQSGLACAGYGSSVCVTAVFGLRAAQQALSMIGKGSAE